MRTRKCIRYICDHCDRGFWARPRCLEHEAACWRNPDRAVDEGELHWNHRGVVCDWSMLDACYWPRADTFCR